MEAGSFPGEVGWCDQNCRGETHLIRPATWTPWSITRQGIQENEPVGPLTGCLRLSVYMARGDATGRTNFLSFSFCAEPLNASIRFLSCLGSDRRSVRRAAPPIQAALAGQVGTSLPTLRWAERGQGVLATFTALAAALGMESGGPFLPPGETKGARLAALRRRRCCGIGPGQPHHAVRCGERQGAHLATVARIGEALG